MTARRVWADMSLMWRIIWAARVLRRTVLTVGIGKSLAGCLRAEERMENLACWRVAVEGGGLEEPVRPARPFRHPETCCFRRLWP